MQTNPTQAAIDLCIALGIPDHHAPTIQTAFAEREARLVAEMAVIQQSHDWMYGEKQRLENALKDIASRAHANLATRETEDRTHD